MSLESATYINDLQAVNPPSGDPVSQGDDHIRLIKTVLQNQFKNASRASSIPTVSVVSTSGAIASNLDGCALFVATGSGPITLTLPTLAAGDAGWSCSFFKTSVDVNPVFIAPASGTLQSGIFPGLAKARRCIPGVASRAVWTGAAWFVTRANAAPIGCMIDYYGTVLPPGFEWPNGQTLASVATNYPEYNAAVGSGSTPDMRGYAGIVLDNLGGAAAGRLPNGQISGSTLGATGGVDAALITTAQMPSHNHGLGTLAWADSGHGHGFGNTYVYGSDGTYYNFASGGSQGGQMGPISIATGHANITVSGAMANAGGSTLLGHLPPSIMLGKLLVVE